MPAAIAPTLFISSLPCKLVDCLCARRTRLKTFSGIDIPYKSFYRRREYMIMSAFEADARRVGILEGKQEGISEGSYQARLETAKNLIDMGLSIENIAKATGLAQKEVEKLQPESEAL